MLSSAGFTKQRNGLDLTSNIDEQSFNLALKKVEIEDGFESSVDEDVT